MMDKNIYKINNKLIYYMKNIVIKIKVLKMEYLIYFNILTECKSCLEEFDILSKEFNRMDIEYRKYLVELGQLNHKFMLHNEVKIDEDFFKNIFNSFILKNELNDSISIHQDYEYLEKIIKNLINNNNELSFLSRLKRANEILDNLIFSPVDYSNDILNCGIIMTKEELDEIMDNNEEDIELEII
jgi:hypothetical protein